MSNQLQITGGAKVRNLEGVLTGTAGVVASVPLGGANGVATLDSSGKVPLSQLPASVITYLGTWNASTNTPTLTNGVGDVGDLYICNVAGTVNFGAGPITFAVGDWVIYSGTTWEKSGGASGTVTSVAMTVPTGLSVTGSPITTSGTLAVDLAAGYTIPTTSFLSGLVPYTGATGNVNLGEYGLSGGYLGLDTTPTGTPTTLGTLSWDDTYLTPKVITGTGATTLQVGQEEVVLIHNNTGSTLTDGQVVYINGSTGNLPTVALADASSETTSAATLGVVTESIANGSNGFITISGNVNGLNTLGYTAGDILWLSETAGQFTNVKPISPAHLVLIGYVVKVSGGNGSILVKIQNTQELEECSDVLFTSLANNDILAYESSTDLWKNKTIANVLGYTPANAADYVPYTGATSSLNLGNYGLTAASMVVASTGTNAGQILLKQGSVFTTPDGYGTFGSGNANNFYFYQTSSSVTRGARLSLAYITGGATRTYTLQDADGTLAFTSDIPSLTGYVTGTGTTNTLPKFTGTSAIGNSNITDTGSLITLGSNSYVNGALGIGTTSLTGITLNVSKNITGSTSSTVINSAGTIQSDVTGTTHMFLSIPATQATAFTLTNLYHFRAFQGTIGASSAITNQYGYHVDATLTGATNNYGFFGNIASGTGRWNLYMNGTANNYMAGSLGIGSTANLGVINLRLSKTITGGTSSYGILSDGAIQSGVTTLASYNRTNSSTQAATFTLIDLEHYAATQGTFGTNSVVTNQYGFKVDSTLIGATNNYGFYGQIASGTNRWNLYMAGTASNYMAGSLAIGTTTTSAKLSVSTTSGNYILDLINGSEGTFALRTYNHGTASAPGLAFTQGLYYNTTENASVRFYRGPFSADGYLSLATNATDRLTITSAGKVGIGTTSPDNTYQGLTIYGTNPSLRLKASETGSWDWIEFVNSSGVNNFSMGVSQSTPIFAIKAGAGLDSPNFAIPSSGNVIIGNVNDGGQKLQVNGLVNMYGYNSFQTSTKTTTSGANLSFDMSTDYGKNSGGDNIGGLVVININEANTNISLGNAAYVGIVVNPRGTGGTITQISRILGGGVSALSVSMSGNSIVVNATMTDGGNYRASMTFIGGGGVS